MEEKKNFFDFAENVLCTFGFMMILMLIFMIGGSILIAIPNLPRSFGGIDIATLIIAYLGYVFLIAACFLYVKTGK